MSGIQLGDGEPKGTMPSARHCPWLLMTVARQEYSCLTRSFSFSKVSRTHGFKMWNLTSFSKSLLAEKKFFLWRQMSVGCIQPVRDFRSSLITIIYQMQGWDTGSYVPTSGRTGPRSILVQLYPPPYPRPIEAFFLMSWLRGRSASCLFEMEISFKPAEGNCEQWKAEAED